MSFINPKTKEINCKIVYYGPPFSGKTTNLHEIHKATSGGSTRNIVSLTTREDRTLFFDFLPLSLGEVHGYKIRLHLYTLPGQPQFEMSRTVILKGMDGVVFVADSQVDQLEKNLASWQEMQAKIKGVGLDSKTLPTVVQFNKRDLKSVLPVDALQPCFNGHPGIEASAVEGKGVMETLHEVARRVLRTLSPRGRGDLR